MTYIDLTLWLRQVQGPLHLIMEMQIETTSPAEVKELIDCEIKLRNFYNMSIKKLI